MLDCVLISAEASNGDVAVEGCGGQPIDNNF